MQMGLCGPEASPRKWAIPLLGIHTEETRIERDTCTPMFIAALFIIARTRVGAGEHPRGRQAGLHTPLSPRPPPHQS